MLPKPVPCRGCALEFIGQGFAPPEGPIDAPICLVGQALGADEARLGRNFIGQAGGMLQRILNLLGWNRSTLRIVNTVACYPPGDWLEGAPWETQALQQCAWQRSQWLAEPHQVFIPLGGIALRTLLDLPKTKNVSVQNFHGTLSTLPDGRFVVPTYHPSFLQRGAHNLIGTVLWDLQQAQKVLRGGRPADPASLVVDPPVEWFEAWITQALAAIRQNPAAFPISVDIETPDTAGRDEDLITVEHQSYTILRVNLACHPDEGLTVPFQGPYIDLLTRLLGEAYQWYWNAAYDTPRLLHAGVIKEEHRNRWLDLMWAWHVLQSDLPRGLGFTAPFYSAFGPWKHLSGFEPARYGAIDGLQTHRCGFGIIGDLVKSDQWATVQRHVHQLHWQALHPAREIGVGIDRSALLAFKADLTVKATTALDALQTLYPDALRPLTPKQGLTAKPAQGVLHVKASAFTRKGAERKGKPANEIKLDLYRRSTVIERQVAREVFVCRTCGAQDVTRKHRCKETYTKKDGTEGLRPSDATPDVQIETIPVTRWYWQEPFNPDSNPQILAYLRHRGHVPGKAKKTRKDTTNRETLERLEKTTKDPFYRTLLNYRAVQKVKSTYVDGTERRLDAHDRVHPEPTFKPSTQRLSYINPNITNVISDRQGPDALAAGYRRCVVAAPGCRLVEVDYSGIEAVEVGWFCRDPQYLRLAKLGVHAGLASHVLGRPYDPRWSETDLAAYFKAIKKAPKGSPEDVAYNRSKRFIHGFSYGLSLRGMILQFPEIFPTLKVATHYAEIFHTMAPSVAAWQQTVRQLAARQHYLGGSDHPFRYKHWFWSVFTYQKVSTAQYYAILKRYAGHEANAPVLSMNGQFFRIGLGEDSKRCIAFLPQSTAAGVLKEAMLRLFDSESPSYIGDAYYGQTPLRAPIHDSLLLEIPDRVFDRVYEAVCCEMLRPIVQQPCPEEWGMGPFLTVGVAAKVGHNWQQMEDLTVPTGVSADGVREAIEDSEQEDWDDLARMATA